MKLIDMLYDPAIEEHQVLRALFAFTMTAFREGDAMRVNEFLGAVDATNLSPLFCSAILRGTFSQQQNLPNWEPLRNRVVQSFKDREIENWENKLRGLLTPSKRSEFGGALDRLFGVHETLQRK